MRAEANEQPGMLDVAREREANARNRRCEEPADADELAAYLAAFAQECLGATDCSDYGIVAQRGFDSWLAHEQGYIELSDSDGLWRLPVAYDERGGPYGTDEQGREQRGLLISLTDEDDWRAAVWARVPEGSELRGVGIDLCDSARFARKPDGRDLRQLVLHKDEIALAPRLCPHDELLGSAMLFAAKEAAFKACAAPLRRWYESHDEQLVFDLRHFVMREPGIECGDGRNGAAQHALERMGIQVRVHHTCIGDYALVVALALAR